MKLNADIVYEWLSKSFPVHMAGPHSTELALMRPTFLEPDSARLEANHLYVCSPDHLPRKIQIDKDSVLVCAGDSPRLQYFRERCCVICTDEARELFGVFNRVQETFNTFSAWEAELNTILTETGDIASLLEASLPIFGTAIHALDANFHFLGIAYPRHGSYPDVTSDQAGDLPASNFRRFLVNNEEDMNNPEPVLYTFDIGSSLNVNLLDGNRYRGCISLWRNEGEYPACAGKLLQFLAQYVLRAVRGLTVVGSGDGSIRVSLHDYVEELPVGLRSQEELRAVSRGRTFACAYIELPSRLSNIPMGYTCGKIEGSFSRCWAFEHHSNVIVAVMDVTERDEAIGTAAWISKMLQYLVDIEGFVLGISDVFDDLTCVHTYFLEAQAAITHGKAANPDASCHSFEDCRLSELLANATGELPLDSFITPGLRALMEHDKSASVDYIDTLRCYLRNNCGVTATARELYLHRSTLVERLDRIFGLMGSKLEDPNERLLTILCLRLLENG